MGFFSRRRAHPGGTAVNVGTGSNIQATQSVCSNGKEGEYTGTVHSTLTSGSSQTLFAQTSSRSQLLRRSDREDTIGSRSLGSAPLSLGPDKLSAKLQKLERYVFNDIPIRFIYIPTMQLVGREFVAKHLRESVDSYLQLGGDKLADFQPDTFIKYAVLSHRWLSEEEEVTKSDFGSLVRGDDGTLTDKKKRGWTKLMMFCKQATQRRIQFAWADTCCIDKTSSAELDESIRSMFRWYRNAALCMVLLAETHTAAQARAQDTDSHDEWFSRGWTLQELIAPRCLKFFLADWTELTTKENDKSSRSPYFIEKVTGITIKELLDFEPGPVKVDQRMCWAAKRRTKRVEDVAYSLMGIFDVSISIAYGEGADRAFCRLFEAIIFAGADVSVLNWAGPSAHHHVSSYVPASPASYLNHPAFDTLITPPKPRRLALTPQGMQVSFVIFPVSVVRHGNPPRNIPCILMPPRSKENRFLRSRKSASPTLVPLNNVRVEPQMRTRLAVGLIRFEPSLSPGQVDVAFRNSGVLLRCDRFGRWERVVTGHISVDLSQGVKIEVDKDYVRTLYL